MCPSSLSYVYLYWFCLVNNKGNNLSLSSQINENNELAAICDELISRVGGK